jgi:hypothetical protein
MEEEQTNTERLQSNVDKMKALSLAQNIHNLTPPTKGNDEAGRDVSIINSLKCDKEMTEKYLTLTGFMFDPLQGVYTLYRRPIMNSLGIGNFMGTISGIAKDNEFASYKEDDIPKWILFYFKRNYPYFTCYADDYELSREDFNLVSSLLVSAIASTLYKAKGGGHRNVVRGTYSEDLLGRVITPDQLQKKGGGFLSALSKLNPLARRER